MEKDRAKMSSDRQLQEARKKTLIGSQVLQGRQSRSLHTWHCQGPCKPSSCTAFMLNSQGRELKKSWAYVHRVAWVGSNSAAL